MDLHKESIVVTAVGHDRVLVEAALPGPLQKKKEKPKAKTRLRRSFHIILDVVYYGDLCPQAHRFLFFFRRQFGVIFVSGIHVPTSFGSMGAFTLVGRGYSVKRGHPTSRQDIATTGDNPRNLFMRSLTLHFHLCLPPNG